MGAGHFTDPPSRLRFRSGYDGLTQPGRDGWTVLRFSDAVVRELLAHWPATHVWLDPREHAPHACSPLPGWSVNDLLVLSLYRALDGDGGCDFSNAAVRRWAESLREVLQMPEGEREGLAALYTLEYGP